MQRHLFLDLALPYDKDAPAERLKRRFSLSIPLHVAGKLWKPVLRARPRHVSVPAASMLMPKAAVHQDNSSVPRQYYVRRARQVSAMQSEAEAHCMQ